MTPHWTGRQSVNSTGIFEQLESLFPMKIAVEETFVGTAIESHISPALVYVFSDIESRSVELTTGRTEGSMAWEAANRFGLG